MTEQEILEVLSGTRPSANHVLGRVDDLEVWKSMGSPHCWEKVAQQGIFIVYQDYGYGLMALLQDGELVGYGKNLICNNDVVVLNPSYYGVEDYIFINPDVF
ncbi:hypothetical protein P13BB106kb_p012 [Pectobacterium phage DU_PP_V]|uniref:Uncharacterized protein n=1 Tax=Pectobacterium phage DU_PP_V TaxID=2041492 RepID=A0A2D2W6S1_9CAUD|nr:hypothetical protein HOS40_gp012 [Pectobacterium phage DU_PP_V]ATS93996.1 hypothetical protein P13BB106kb_p012 [Pectobacterium phage DU_PP_V]